MAKLSGVLLAYPGLKIEVEGHTDNVGSNEYNQRLSRRGLAAGLARGGIGLGADVGFHVAGDFWQRGKYGSQAAYRK